VYNLDAVINGDNREFIDKLQFAEKGEDGETELNFLYLKIEY
jgi:hypothetical protein